MKNPLEMLKEISNLLNVELSADTKETEVEAEVVKTNLAEMVLDNGTVIEAEVFEAGAEVFIVSDEDRIALPVGEYTMEDGQVLKVEEEGVIATIGTTEEPTEEVEAMDEKEEMSYATKMELEEVKQMVEEVKEMVAAMGDKEEMSTEAESIEQEKKELKEELSQPAAQPLKHSPENKTETRPVDLRTMSTRDRIHFQISQINK